MRKVTAIILSLMVLALNAGALETAHAQEVLSAALPLPSAAQSQSSAETVKTFIPQSTYLSPVKQSPLNFTGLGIDWHQISPPGTMADISVRFKSAKGWSDWMTVAGDIEERGSEDIEHPSAFMATEMSDSLQYRVYLKTTDLTQTPVVENIRFTYINSNQKFMGSADISAASLDGVSTTGATTGASATGALPSSNRSLFASILTSDIGETSNTATSGAPATGALLPNNESHLAETSTVAANTVATKIKVPRASTSVKIISRSEWGADEGLRLLTEDRPAAQLVKIEDDFYTKYAAELKIKKKVSVNSEGKDLTWPLDYPVNVTKFIIHHTATAKNLDNPMQAIRDIYYWHAITKGWGDIGYNYIIDQQGNIYEGRYGGDGVVGAHAGRGNIGSIGIAVLGNYQDNEVPDAVINSLTALIKVKAAKFNIDTTGSSSFRGQYLANVFGHREIMSTTCPGDNLNDLIPAIRLAAKGDFIPKTIDRRRATTGENQYDFTLNKNTEVLSFKPGENQTLKLTLKNTGTATWGTDTYMILSNDENAQKYLYNAKMVRSASAGKAIAPGASASFNIGLQGAYSGGITTLEFFPFIDGKLKVEKYISVPIQVEAPNYDYEYVKLEVVKPYLKKGETTTATLILKNTGNTTWKRDGANRIMIGTQKPQDRISLITPKSGTRLAGLQEREVKPGSSGHFTIEIKAPTYEGAIREYFAPVIEGVSWMKFKENYLELYVYDTQFLAKIGTIGGDKTLLPGATGKITVEYLNAGGSIWKVADDKGFRVDVSNGGSLKLGKAEVDQSQTLPGQKAKITLSVTAPAAEGVYTFNLTPKVGARTLTARPDTITITVGKQKTSGQQSHTVVTAADSIRISISYHSNPVISADGVFRLAGATEDLAQFAKNEKVSVTYDQGKYMVKGDKQAFALSAPPRFEPDGTSVLRIDNFERRPAWDTSYNDNEFKGALEVHWYESTIHIVNELPMEDYLRGLAEISATDPYEKIKAVIVLARSYGYYYTKVGEKFPGAPFDLSDDPERSQKYLGYGFEKRNQTGVKAVNDTLGVIVTYKGKIIKTPYFSSDDGRTRSAEEVWGWTDTPWLASVDDPGCKGMSLNGHGVGLSGCGSFYLANLGKTYPEIIKYYFNGVDVGRK